MIKEKTSKHKIKGIQNFEKAKFDNNILKLKQKTVSLPRTSNNMEGTEMVEKPKETNKKHLSSMNVINNLLFEKKNMDKQKLLGKRLKKQRHNYLLNSNQDLHLSKSRKILTSLEQFRNLKKVIPNVRLHNTGIRLHNNFSFKKVENWG